MERDEELLGKDVYNEKDEKVGKVEDLIDCPGQGISSTVSVPWIPERKELTWRSPPNSSVDGRSGKITRPLRRDQGWAHHLGDAQVPVPK